MTTGLQNEEIVQLLRWASNSITIQERKTGLSNYSVSSKENSPTQNMRIQMGHLRHLGTTSPGAPIPCTLCGLGANHWLLNKGWPLFPASDFVMGCLVCNLSSPPRFGRCPAPPITRTTPLLCDAPDCPSFYTSERTSHPTSRTPGRQPCQGQSLFCVAQQAIPCVSMCVWSHSLLDPVPSEMVGSLTH